MLDVNTLRMAGKQVSGRAELVLAPARALARRIAPALPVTTVALMLIAMAYSYYVLQGYNTKSGYAAVAAFADIGTISGHHLGLDPLVMNNNPVGFDGQFYYFITLDPSQPWICPSHPPRCALDLAFGEVRAERLLYPYTAWLFTLGRAQLVPYALLAVNFIAILLTAWLVGRMAVEAGASRWLGAAAGLYCGQILAFLRDLADPFAVMWVVIAVYFLRKERYLLSAAAVAAALLTREQLILTLPLLALPLLAQRRWRLLAASAVVALGPFVLLQVVLRVLWGKWALLSGDTAGAGVAGGIIPIPFYGLWTERHRYDFGLIVAYMVIPLVLAVLVSLASVRQRGWRSLLSDPVPALVVVYTVLLSLTSWILWQDAWTPGRLADLAVVLGVIVAARARLPALRVSYATLLAISSLAPLMLIIR
jgi:hypothetical protein